MQGDIKMCGIYGFAYLSKKPMSLNDLKTIDPIIRFLALENKVRGRDSTGMGFINQNGDMFNVRKTKDSEDFLESNFVNNQIHAMLNRDTIMCLGHTRAATHGAVILNNAQPFIIGNIMGTHNGIISNHEDIIKRLKVTPQTTCDSEALFQLLNVSASLKGKAKKLRDAYGYAASAFYDKRVPHTIFFARSNNNVNVAMTGNKKFIFWSSEKLVLTKVKNIFKVAMDYIDFDDNHLMSISLAAQIEKTKIRDYPSYSSGGYGATDHWRGSAGYTATGGYKPYDPYNRWSKCEICELSDWVRYDVKNKVDMCKGCYEYFLDDTKKEFKVQPGNFSKMIKKVNERGNKPIICENCMYFNTGIKWNEKQSMFLCDQCYDFLDKPETPVVDKEKDAVGPDYSGYSDGMMC